jgi:hypothetical protein
MSVMPAAANDSGDLTDRKAVERQASTQLTTLTSLLAGFGFAWFTTLVGGEVSAPLSLIVLVVTALTIFVLVLASIIGALLTIASEVAVREGPLRRRRCGSSRPNGESYCFSSTSPFCHIARV